MPDNATDPELVEALSLLRDHDMERRRKPGRNKDDAAKRLLAQLMALNGRYDFTVRSRHGDWYELAVQLHGAHVDVTYHTERGVMVARHEAQGAGTEVPLDHDREGNVLLGREPDTFRTPIPGEPIPRRPGIAVLLEAIIAAANTSTKR